MKFIDLLNIEFFVSIGGKFLFTDSNYKIFCIKKNLKF